MKGEKHHILMADIIESSGKPGDSLMQTFKTEVKKVNKAFSEDIMSPLTITLGDEFQGVVKDMPAAVAIIFHLDQSLLRSDPGFKMRYVINYGVIETPVNGETAYEMLGEGLTKARLMLGRLKSTSHEVAVEGLEDKTTSTLNMAFELYRSFYNAWTGDDRVVAALFLEHADYRVVARKYDRNPSSMWRREKSLKMREFNTSKTLIQTLING